MAMTATMLINAIKAFVLLGAPTDRPLMFMTSGWRATSGVVVKDGAVSGALLIGGLRGGLKGGGILGGGLKGGGSRYGAGAAPTPPLLTVRCGGRLPVFGTFAPHSLQNCIPSSIALPH
jgi:hypothetical protein